MVGQISFYSQLIQTIAFLRYSLDECYCMNVGDPVTSRYFTVHVDILLSQVPIL